jgi:GNAT superfamily N-acetyltransferase
MHQNYIIKRTTTVDPHFKHLISCLDNELWNELGEDQATYDPHNKLPNLVTAIVVYAGEEPVASGCFRSFDYNTIEIKRMFVKKQHRGKGLSKMVLNELEKWATEKGFQYSVLETSIHFDTACRLYNTSGYSTIPNYGPYAGLADSVCMKKTLNS